MSEEILRWQEIEYAEMYYTLAYSPKYLPSSNISPSNGCRPRKKDRLLIRIKSIYDVIDSMNIPCNSI